MFVIASGDLAPVITAFGALLTVVSGIGFQIWQTIRQNKKIESNHVEVMDKLERPGQQETSSDSPKV